MDFSLTEEQTMFCDLSATLPERNENNGLVEFNGSRSA